ncbi:interferon-induced, double-stranded RNA-activated protein kinase isoform X2 [Denticeps clupeoides]|uniref:non-specific serine/threonine protein kinase n=1 Tax=Denticeps clupeoides TaxID=299321 RepID=A0AAY4ELS9_9TELE|nr:interferon-induced, double-stranded RNA-activated protein kinase-like isoform X2 [Denticeps clupeoides]
MGSIARLNHYGQIKRVSVRFEDVGASGPDHIKTFTIRAVVNNTTYHEGSGRNKKEAKEKAAQKALDAIGLLEATEEKCLRSPSTSGITATITQPNYQCWLNEHSHRTRITFTPIDSTRIGSLTTPQCCRYLAGGKEYPEGYGRNKKEAREEAARLVYQTLREEAEMTGDSCPLLSSRQHSLNLSESDSGLSGCLENMTPKIASRRSVTETNFIGIVNHYCQKTGQVHDYKMVDKKGPAHAPVFVYRVVMAKKEYPDGEGHTAMEAKQRAAQQAWEALQEQSDWNSQVSLKSTVSEDEIVSQTPNTSEGADMASDTSDSIIFKDSSAVSSPKEMHAENNKTKIKLAVKFPREADKRKEDDLTFKKHSEETHLHSPSSRFELDFESVRQIGKGGFGRVFKARRKLEKRDYAVKVVRRTEKAEREVGALADLQHENIVRYYTCWIEETQYKHDGSDTYSTSSSGSGSSAGFLYIQMELCGDKTLRVCIDEWNSHRNPQRRQDSLHFIHQIMRGVEYIHSKNLIHRDLKPPNILFGNENNGKQVKIGDFGLVTASDNDNDEGLLERTKRTGTRSYMSPEQMNKTTYDRKVDVFSIGLIYFELLWNLSGMEKQKTWESIRSKKFPARFCEEFSIEKKLIEQMLCSQPMDRPDAKDLSLELEKCRDLLLKHQNRESKVECHSV